MSDELVSSSEAENQRLRAQYTQIAQLAGGLAHEIKNPLSTIRLNMELLAEDLGEPQTPNERRAQNKIATVQRECQRLQDLLEDFLKFTRAHALNPQVSDLNEEVQLLLDFYRPQADEAGIELIPYLATRLPAVQLDREVFRGALLNLVLNAQQAMPTGGQMVVRTQATQGGGVTLELIDNGVGMDEQTRSKMFDAFFSTKSGGSGLGLPTTHKIIEEHGGHITVESEPDRGTRFTIELPPSESQK